MDIHPLEVLVSMGSPSEPNSVKTPPPKQRIARRRPVRRGRPGWAEVDPAALGDQGLDDEPLFSRAELTGSGFDALLAELDGSMTLDLGDDD